MHEYDGDGLDAVGLRRLQIGAYCCEIWFLLDRAEYSARLKEIGAVYRDIMGRRFPAMTAVEVSGLIEDRAKVEIQAIAVVPDPA